VTNSLRLLQLPKEAQADLVAGRLSAGHARALLALENDTARSTLAREIVHRGLTVREAERAAAKAPAKPRTRPDPDVARLESDLGRALGTKVRIVATQGGAGRIEMEFYSDDDLARLADRLRPGRRA
jgi:ParB family chromosome partitioning protein